MKNSVASMSNPLACVSIILCGCNINAPEKEFIIELDSTVEHEHSFNQLPMNVQFILNENIEQIGTATRYYWYACDSTENFVYAKTSRADTWMREVTSKVNHFFIDGFHYRLKGNYGHPFIYCNETIYYCESYLNRGNYRNKMYFSRKLPRV